MSDHTFQTHTLPHYVRDYFGKGFTLEKIGKNVWSFHGPRATYCVRAKTAAGARTRVRDHVARIRPATDRRRKYWEYT